MGGFVNRLEECIERCGIFLGGALLTLLGFTGAVLAMALALGTIWLISIVLLQKDLGKASNKPKFRELLSKSRAINILSAARLFLFGARDVWFVIALPVFLSSQLGWNFWQVGSYLAAWVVGYGIVQSIAPALMGSNQQKIPGGRQAFTWALALTFIPAAIALGLMYSLTVTGILIGGLLIFGVVFAINSSLHSYLIVSYAKTDGASLDVGFYYMANALGRLLGTLLSGWVYQSQGLIACLWISAGFIAVAALMSLALPPSVPMRVSKS